MKTNDLVGNTGAEHVPSQRMGSEMNAVEQITLASEVQAIHFFQTVKEQVREDIRLIPAHVWVNPGDGKD